MVAKVLGAVLVVGAASMAGITAADHIKEKYQNLQELQRICCQLKSEIRYSRSYLEEAFLHIAGTAKEPYKEWLSFLASQMEERRDGSFKKLWETSVHTCLRGKGLERTTLQKLKDLGHQLGTADVELQVQTLDLYLEDLRLTAEELRETMKTKVRLYRCLVIMGGVFVMILLM